MQQNTTIKALNRSSTLNSLSYRALFKTPFRTILTFDPKKDYYKILDLSSTASAKDIKTQFYKLAKVYHPDMNKGKEDKFKEINEAYEVIGDEAKRKQYDEMRLANANAKSSSSSYNTNNAYNNSYTGYSNTKTNYGYTNNNNNGYGNGNNANYGHNSYYSNYQYNQGPQSGYQQNSFYKGDSEYYYYNPSKGQYQNMNPGGNPNSQFFQNEEQLKQYMKILYTQKMNEFMRNKRNGYGPAGPDASRNSFSDSYYDFNYNTGNKARSSSATSNQNMRKSSEEAYKVYQKYKEDEYKRMQENEILRKKNEEQFMKEAEKKYQEFMGKLDGVKKTFKNIAQDWKDFFKK